MASLPRSHFGIEVGCTVRTDASAAIGIVHRHGLGKTRYMELQYLRMQQDVQPGKLQVAKVGTDANPADVMTKHPTVDRVNTYSEWMCYNATAGRAARAPGLQSCLVGA